MKQEVNYRLEITIAFILYSFFIIVSILFLINFYLTKISIEEFQEKVLLSSKNIETLFHTQQKVAEQTTEGIARESLSSKFKTDIYYLQNIFKTFLIANENFIELGYKLDKKNSFVCIKSANRLKCGLDIDVKLPQLHYKVAKDKIVIVTDLKKFFEMIPEDIFNFIIIDRKGNLLYSNFLKANSIFDMFNKSIADKLLNNDKKFITNDIYVSSITDNYKMIFIQNKKTLKKQQNVSMKVSILILIISMIIALPFGYFFSTPLYQFYEQLNKRVKEELEKNREKEQLLMHQSKLASLGEMLGNIAHQWRHPLTHLSLLIQNLNMAFKMGKCDKSYIDKFSEKANFQIDYMSQTIDDFTNFFKKDKKKQEFWVENVIEDVLKLLEGRLKDVKVEKEYRDKIKLYGYKTEFSQVILNIINNAIDILKEREVKEKKITIRMDKNSIEIEDNGGGVDEAIMEKIFEPYFTTKFQSLGTGIGLYMSKIIITKHFNSELEVYNSKSGAVFKIALF